MTERNKTLIYRTEDFSLFSEVYHICMRLACNEGRNFKRRFTARDAFPFFISTSDWIRHQCSNCKKNIEKFYEHLTSSVARATPTLGPWVCWTPLTLAWLNSSCLEGESIVSRYRRTVSILSVFIKHLPLHDSIQLNYLFRQPNYLQRRS